MRLHVYMITTPLTDRPSWFTCGRLMLGWKIVFCNEIDVVRAVQVVADVN